jgi:hypothetical protein
VDNFCMVFFFNDFNAHSMKSCNYCISRDFSWITRVSCG